jgi:hypothetical protein
VRAGADRALTELLRAGTLVVFAGWLPTWLVSRAFNRQRAAPAPAGAGAGTGGDGAGRLLRWFLPAAIVAAVVVAVVVGLLVRHVRAKLAP